METLSNGHWSPAYRAYSTKRCHKMGALLIQKRAGAGSGGRSAALAWRKPNDRH